MAGLSKCRMVYRATLLVTSTLNFELKASTKSSNFPYLLKTHIEKLIAEF